MVWKPPIRKPRRSEVMTLSSRSLWVRMSTNSLSLMAGLRLLLSSTISFTCLQILSLATTEQDQESRNHPLVHHQHMSLLPICHVYSTTWNQLVIHWSITNIWAYCPFAMYSLQREISWSSTGQSPTYEPTAHLPCILYNVKSAGHPLVHHQHMSLLPICHVFSTTWNQLVIHWSITNIWAYCPFAMYTLQREISWSSTGPSPTYEPTAHLPCILYNMKSAGHPLVNHQHMSLLPICHVYSTTWNFLLFAWHGILIFKDIS